jgi:hypothetical protein
MEREKGLLLDPLLYFLLLWYLLLPSRLLINGSRVFMISFAPFHHPTRRIDSVQTGDITQCNNPSIVFWVFAINTLSTTTLL